MINHYIKQTNHYFVQISCFYESLNIETLIKLSFFGTLIPLILLLFGYLALEAGLEKLFGVYGFN